MLARSNIGEVTPIEQIDFVPFTYDIRERLRMDGFEKLLTIQQYSIPAIMRGHNTVMVSKPHSGKTLGYILPLMNHLSFGAKEIPLANGGPLAVIVCSRGRNCAHISETCKRFANFGAKENRILAAFGVGADAKYVEVLMGCELLIGTPNCLARLLGVRRVTSFDRLKWLVLDDFNALAASPHFSKAVKSIMRLSQKKARVQPIQYIVAAETLSEKVWEMMKNFGQYSLHLGSYTEAAIYARLKPIVHTVDNEKKLCTAVDEIVGEIGKRRIAVVCCWKSEVLKLAVALQHRGYEPLVLCRGMPQFYLDVVQQKWRTTAYPLLLCTDDSFTIEGFRIHDATLLFHYSIPFKSEDMLGTRFCLVMDHYRNHFNESEKDENDIKSDEDVKILIYLDEESKMQKMQKKSILSLLKRLESDDGKIVSRLSQKMEEIDSIFGYVQDLVEKSIAAQHKNFGLALDPKKLEPFRPRWAHFHKDFVGVNFIGADGPHAVYLRDRQFNGLFISLENDCQKMGDREVVKKEPLLLEVGAFCLARDGGSGRWNRGQVKYVAADSVIVLFVDYGDLSKVAHSNLTRISLDLIARLPFQAIECQLGGIWNIPQCPKSIIDQIYVHCGNNDDHCWARVLPTDVAPSLLGGRTYKVNLFDAEGRSIGRLIAEEFGLARKATEEEFLFDIEFDVGVDTHDDVLIQLPMSTSSHQAWRFVWKSI